MTRRRWITPTRALVLAGLAAALIAVPLSGASLGRPSAPKLLLGHVSQAPTANYWAAHPSRAPQQLRQRFEALKAYSARASARPAVQVPKAPNSAIFTNDNLGLPQNEESIAACKADPKFVLGGTNDYRGLIDSAGNFTGWSFSRNGGTTLYKAGLLPPVDTVPSGGDPVSAVFGPSCTLYAASLNYDPDDPFFKPNGIGVYRTTPSTVVGSDCAPVSPFGLADADCWPKGRFAAFTANNDPEQLHFYDKPWMTVGASAPFGTAVWVTYSDFRFPGDEGEDFNASVYAVRCNAALTSCTDPILISGGDVDIQFSDVTIGADGRTYISWSEIQGELEGTQQRFIHKLRIAPSGSTTFGPTRVIASEGKPIPFGGSLQGNDFRIATYLKTTVAPNGGGQRIFAIWDACRELLLRSLCVQPFIKFRYSDDDGATWTAMQLAPHGVDYFPTIDYDATTDHVVAAWYTNRYDPVFLNEEDVYAVKFDPGAVDPEILGRMTNLSDETEADPTLGGFFIGDYFEVAAAGGDAFIHYNTNRRKLPFLGPLGVGTIPVPQQDNFLAKQDLHD